MYAYAVHAYKIAIASLVTPSVLVRPPPTPFPVAASVLPTAPLPPTTQSGQRQGNERALRLTRSRVGVAERPLVLEEERHFATPTEAVRKRGSVDLTHLRHAAIGRPRLSSFGAAVANVGEVTEGAAGLWSSRVPAPWDVLRLSDQF